MGCGALEHEEERFVAVVIGAMLALQARVQPGRNDFGAKPGT